MWKDDARAAAHAILYRYGIERPCAAPHYKGRMFGLRHTACFDDVCFAGTTDRENPQNSTQRPLAVNSYLSLIKMARIRLMTCKVLLGPRIGFKFLNNVIR